MTPTIIELYNLLTKKETNHLGQQTKSVVLDFSSKEDAEHYFNLLTQLEQEIALYCAYD